MKTHERFKAGCWNESEFVWSEKSRTQNPEATTSMLVTDVGDEMGDSYLDDIVILVTL